jgi:hypothetical protein
MELVMARSQELQRLQAELEAAVDETFARYGAACLWWMRRPANVVPGTARTMAYSLRREGPAAARALVERLEDLSDAVESAAEEGAGGDRSAA